MSERSQCPDPETLAAWSEGRLTSDAREMVVFHLDSCAVCRETLGMVMTFPEEKPLKEVALTRKARIKSFPKYVPSTLAAAAAALLLFLILPTWLSGERSIQKAKHIIIEDLARLEREGHSLSHNYLTLPVKPKNPKVLRGSDSAELEEAIGILERVVERNPWRDVARAWLISLLIISEDYEGAIAQGGRFERQSDSNPKSRGLIQLARYRLAQKKGDKEMMNRAIESMEALYEDHKDHPSIAYNLGEMLWEKPARDKAKPVWEHFLELETEGVYADRVRRLLGR